MGGFGSGQHLRSRIKRQLVENCPPLMLRDIGLRKYINHPEAEKYFSELSFYKDSKYLLTLKCELLLVSNDWYLKLENLHSYDEIRLSWIRSNNCNKQPIMHCPGCASRVKKIFLKPYSNSSWRCLKCHDLTHLSSLMSCRLTTFQKSVAEDLGVTAEFIHCALNKPWRLHKPNFTIQETIYTEKTKMKQTTIHLSVYQIKVLNEISKTKDIPRSELIRRAIDEYLEKHNNSFLVNGYDKKS